jgi:hypothetical protein
VAGCCECGDEPSGSCAMELVNFIALISNPKPLLSKAEDLKFEPQTF